MNLVQSAIAWVMAPGRQRWVSALAFGVLAAFALPPFYLVPLLWPSFVVLMALCHSAASWRQAALEGWLFGVGFFGFGLYWIGHAFLVDAERYAALIPVAVGGISVGMAIFIALPVMMTNILARRLDAGRMATVLLASSFWTLSEWLRGWLLTGFPWNPISSVWGISSEMMQMAALGGSLGLSFLTILVFAAPHVAMAGDKETSQRRLLFLLGVSLLLPIIWAGGAMRLAGADTATRDGVVLRLVQPAIRQADKWQQDLRSGHVLKQMAMSKRTAGPAGPPTLVIWSETNVPYVIDPDSPIPASLAAAVPQNGHLIFGAPRRDEEGRVFNSMFAINDDGRLQGTFDKFHLVPFGEYVPLRGLLPFEKLTAGRGDFAAGTGPKTMRIEGVPPFAAIICYEIIFSGNVIDAADRPEWILNITNDAWFGTSSGPQQHFVQARFRAIEEGLPVVRVANNGISAVIDAHGRIRNHLALNEQGIVDAPLPTFLQTTPFAAYRDAFGVGMALGALAVVSFAARRRQRKRD